MKQGFLAVPAVLALAACGGGEPAGPPGSPGPGTLRIAMVTTGLHLDPDGYFVTVDGGPARAVAIDGSITFPDLAAGAHAVDLAGLALNCVELNPSPVTVSVGATGTTTLAVEVECGQLVFVGLVGLNDEGIAIVETVTHSVVGQIPVSGVVSEIVLSPNRRILYALASLGNADTVVIAETESLEILARIGVDGADQTLAISRDGTEVYVPNISSGTLVIDTDTKAVVATISTNRRNLAVAASPVADIAWVAGVGVEEIDLISWQVVRQASPGGRTLLVSGDGARLYTESFNDLYVLDTADLSIIDVLDLSTIGRVQVGDMTMSVDASLIYLANVDRQRVDVLETSTLNKVGEHNTNNPARLVVSPDGASLYVSTTLTSALQRVSLTSGAIFSIEMSDGARGLVMTDW